MKNSLRSIGLAIFVLTALQSSAQRYATEIFSSNQLESDVLFGANVDPFSIANFLVDPDGWNADMAALNENIDNQEAFPENYFIPNAALPPDDQTTVKLIALEMDIYTPPAEDDVTERPLIIFIHTGNFLPPLFNGGITGDKIDSAGVNLCRQWARRGFVSASINYRLG
jgi:acetyl esterase/lipase